MKLHADHRTVFETQHGMLGRQVAHFERAEDAQEYVRLRAALDKAEEIARQASLMLADEHHDYNGCRFTGADVEEEHEEVGVTCFACLVQDKLAEIRAERLAQEVRG